LTKVSNNQAAFQNSKWNHMTWCLR
jgi:hypothetical protein